VTEGEEPPPGEWAKYQAVWLLEYLCDWIPEVGEKILEPAKLPVSTRITPESLQMDIYEQLNQLAMEINKKLLEMREPGEEAPRED